MLLDKLIARMFDVFIDIEEKHDWEAFMGRPSIALVCYLFNAHHAYFIAYKWNYWQIKYLVVCSNNAIGRILNWRISVLYRNPCLQYKWLDNSVQLIW